MKKFLILSLAFLGFACKDTRNSDLGPNILVGISPTQTYYVEGDSILFSCNISAIEGIREFNVDHLTRNLKLLALGEDFFNSSTTQGIQFYYVIDTSENTGDTALINFDVIDTELLTASSLFEYKVAEKIDTASFFIGDQENSNFNNFISLRTLKTYSAAEAIQNSDSIDLIVYRDSILNWVLLSPSVLAPNDSLIPELANFQTRRNVRFNTGLFSSAEFTSLNNDGILVAEDSIPAENYIDSINVITTFYVYTPGNRKGLVRLSNFSDTIGNFGLMEIKIQQ